MVNRSLSRIELTIAIIKWLIPWYWKGVITQKVNTGFI